jgi:hypothetical protein
MSFNLIEFHRLRAVGGATWRKYERLMYDAQGATAGSPAHLAKVDFERAWTTDRDAVIAQCNAEAKPALVAKSKPKPKPEPEPESESEEPF